MECPKEGDLPFAKDIPFPKRIDCPKKRQMSKHSVFSLSLKISWRFRLEKRQVKCLRQYVPMKIPIWDSRLFSLFFSLKSGHPLVVLTVRQKSSFYHFKTVVRPPEVALQPTFWLGRESRHARCASLFSRIKPCKVVLLKDPLFF
jgi:hypothetical protein